MQRYYTDSSGIFTASEQPALLNGSLHKLPVFGPVDANAIAVGWGLKKNTRRIKNFADKHQLPYWQLEDGFISYLGHPAQGDKRFSLITDSTGIYYDAAQPSDIERLLNNPYWQTPELIDRAAHVLDRITEHCISKYNHEPLVGEISALFADKAQERVLVVDQTFGDCSVTHGLANADSFMEMLSAALTENPKAEVWVKIHPDVALGTKRGYYPIEKCGTRIKGVNSERVRVLATTVNAQSLFPAFSKVYVVTSQLGFEALWHNKTVVCFGVPFYSGWGLTDDRVPLPRRAAKHSVESLFAAACLLYSRYINPETGQRCELEDVLSLIIRQQQYNKPKVETLYALGFSVWKRAFVSRFARGLAKRTVFVSNEKTLFNKLTAKDGVLVWGMTPLTCSVPLWRMEDGFIRSVGLGAQLRRPCSLVLDSRGIYYNAQQPSDLEHALNTQSLSAEQCRQGQQLQQQLLAQRISKYNLQGNGQNPFSEAQPQQRKVLVTGQVDSDASLKYGSPQVFSNRDLLQRVNRFVADDNAYIVYKPHPDVVQAGRAGHVPEAEALQWADRVVTDVDIFDAISHCDELHVMSSQAGFEALLQQKTVHCWGMPFYAGWGLTVDHLTCERRTQKRRLEELVYIALCVYPRYINWRSGRFTTVERLLPQLAQERAEGGASSSGVFGWLERKGRKLAFLWEALRETA